MLRFHRSALIDKQQDKAQNTGNCPQDGQDKVSFIMLLRVRGKTAASNECPEHGVRAVVDPDNMRIEYGDVSLGVGGEAAVPSPVTALPLLLQALREGSTLQSWTEREGDRTLCVRELYVTDDCTLALWLDGETMLPRYAEFRLGGRTAVRCEIREFTFI